MDTSEAIPAATPLIGRIRASDTGEDEAVAGPYGIRRGPRWCLMPEEVVAAREAVG